MNIFEKLEKHYKNEGYKTYRAANEHNQLLLFYPMLKSSKIYGIHKSDDDELIDLGCFELAYGKKPNLPFRDCSYDNYDKIIAKMKKVDEDATEEMNMDYDKDYDDSYVYPFILLFENQENVIMKFLEANKYNLLSL